MTPGDTRPLLTPAEAARLAKVSRKTIYREIDRGELRALRAGHQLRVDLADLVAYLERGSR
jgi:excisionase family DNA binding protein